MCSSDLLGEFPLLRQLLQSFVFLGSRPGGFGGLIRGELLFLQFDQQLRLDLGLFPGCLQCLAFAKRKLLKRQSFFCLGFDALPDQSLQPGFFPGSSARRFDSLLASFAPPL